MDRDVLRAIDGLRQKRHNLTNRDIEEVAKMAGWTHDRTTRHIIYVKEGFWANLSIPQGRLKGNTASRLLGLIEASIHQANEEETDES